jgi:hypothetical protein
MQSVNNFIQSVSCRFVPQNARLTTARQDANHNKRSLGVCISDLEPNCRLNQQSRLSFLTFYDLSWPSLAGALNRITVVSLQPTSLPRVDGPAHNLIVR